jgi:hypothetical protein
MVDCALLFLTQDSDENKRKENPIIVNILGLKDSLEKLTARS